MHLILEGLTLQLILLVAYFQSFFISELLYVISQHFKIFEKYGAADPFAPPSLRCCRAKQQRTVAQPEMVSLLFQFIVYISCHHLITKGPQALQRHLYFMQQKIWQLKDRRLPIRLGVEIRLFLTKKAFLILKIDKSPLSILSSAEQFWLGKCKCPMSLLLRYYRVCQRLWPSQSKLLIR